MKLKTGLSNFLKSECSGFDNGACLFNNKCLVLDGKRCKYFEQSVLGKPAYRYKSTRYDYEKLFKHYAAINPEFSSKAKKVSVRVCDCGQPLLPRQRFCESCAQKRRRQTYRESRQRKKLLSATVNENSPQNSLL